METKTLSLLPSALQALFHDLMPSGESQAEPLATQQSTYYRSRLFTAHAGINPLITAAQPLLSILSRLLNNNAHPDNTETIQPLLSHELKAFVARAQSDGYSDKLINMARYLLCTALDDAREQGANKPPATASQAIMKLETEGSSEHFFLLINQTRQQPDSFLDIIELAYLILALGYAGAYRFMASGKIELENILEKLYQTIRLQRGDQLPSLLAATPQVVPTKSTKHSHVHLGWLSLLVFCILCSFFVVCTYVLNDISRPLVLQPSTSQSVNHYYDD